MVKRSTLSAHVAEHATVGIGKVPLAENFVERADRLTAVAAYLDFNLKNIINNVGYEISTQ